jgi:class 3 adenylate cyclase
VISKHSILLLLYICVCHYAWCLRLVHRCEYALAGDMVNLAARLAARADAEHEGCVLCDQFTIQVKAACDCSIYIHMRVCNMLAVRACSQR